MKRIVKILDGRVVDVCMVDHASTDANEIESETANIGDIFDGKNFSSPSFEAISKDEALKLARQVCDGMIDRAYCSKRLSLYGYLAFLSVRANTEDQKRDLETLISAAEWEEAMISAIPEIASSCDQTKIINAQWPKLNKTISDNLVFLASVS